MKGFYFRTLALILSLTTSQQLLAGTFTSAATGNWHTPATWAFSGDADGVPDMDDDVTILSGHAITIQPPAGGGSTAGGVVNNLTINSGGSLALTYSITIYGNYTNNGTETGSYNEYLRGVGKTISGSGTFSSTAILHFGANCNLTIAAGTTITKTNPTTVNYYNNSNVTNNGNFSFWASNLSGTGIVFTNGPTGVVQIGFKNFMAGQTFNASAVGNTVKIAYANNLLPMPVGATYHHLMIVTNLLSLSQNTIVNGNFTINPSSSLNTNNFDISIKGNFTRNGPWTASSGHFVTMNGTTAQTISTSAALLSTPIVFKGLVIDNPTSVTLTSGTYQIGENLTINQGTFNLNSKTVTLTSDAVTTAIIGTCGASASVTNGANMKIQRFISARSAGYSDMAACYSGKTISTLWDTDLLLVYAYSPPDQYPSVFGYSETAYDYVPVTSSSTVLALGQGYEVYLDSDGSQTTFNATTLHFDGVPYIGSLNISGTITDNNDGWNLIGNPYHANLSWDALFATTSNISSNIMFYDETISDFTTVGTGSGQLIAPSQGFWVQATSTSPSLTFTEAIKSTSTSSNFRSMHQELFTVRLKSVGGTRYTSGAAFRFSNNPETAQGDIVSFKGLPIPEAPTFCSIGEDGKKLRVNVLNSSNNEVTVPMKFTVGEAGIYTLEAQNVASLNFENYTCALLTDKKTNRTINLLEENYQFYAETSDDQNRFSLRLVKNGNCTNSSDAVAANNMIDINRQYDNTVVKLNFAEPTFAKITITDLLGQEIVPAQSVTATQQNVYLTIPDQFSGIYLVNVFYSGQVKSKKLFK